MKNWLISLRSRDARRSPRHDSPLLVTYYWAGESATPAPQCIQNISPNGFYLLTEQRWYLGTLIRMTMQWTDEGNSIAVVAKVVRSGTDGVGFEFEFAAAKNARSFWGADANRMADKKTIREFLQRLQPMSASSSPQTIDN
jgi:hypothetical protein